MSPDYLTGLDAVAADAIAFKVLPAPRSAEQRAELIRILPRPGPSIAGDPAG